MATASDIIAQAIAARQSGGPMPTGYGLSTRQTASAPAGGGGGGGAATNPVLPPGSTAGPGTTWSPDPTHPGQWILTSPHGDPLTPGQVAAAGGGTVMGGGGQDPTKSKDGSTTDQANQSALAVLQNELDAWGFAGQATWAWNEIISGKGVDQILFDLRQTDFYKNSIFGKTNALRRANNLPVMDEATILSYKNEAKAAFRAAGIPNDFYSSDDELAQFMGQDISQTELQDRIKQGYTAAASAPAEYRQALNNLYGIDQGHLTAFFLDPAAAEPIIMAKFAAAKIAGEAAITGYNPNLAVTPAEQLAAQGVTEQQARTGFGHLGLEQQLFNPLPGESEQAVAQNVQLGAEFSQNAADQQQIENVARRRVAQFQGGGDFAAGRSGIAGLGAASNS